MTDLLDIENEGASGFSGVVPTILIMLIVGDSGIHLRRSGGRHDEEKDEQSGKGWNTGFGGLYLAHGTTSVSAHHRDGS